MFMQCPEGGGTQIASDPCTRGYANRWVPKSLWQREQDGGRFLGGFEGSEAAFCVVWAVFCRSLWLISINSHVRDDWRSILLQTEYHNLASVVFSSNDRRRQPDCCHKSQRSRWRNSRNSRVKLPWMAGEWCLLVLSRTLPVVVSCCCKYDLEIPAIFLCQLTALQFVEVH